MIYQSDIVEWLQNYTGPKYHAVLSDPPYGLAFMGKSWDNMAPKEFQEWVTEWGSLLLGVVYPGAIGMFFGGTRTFHRLTVGLEDAGWEIFDVCMFLYGSGFPKSHDISKALTRQPDVDKIREIKLWLRQQIEASGKTLAQIDAKCGFRASGYLTTEPGNDAGGRATWHLLIPMGDKWHTLKSVVGFDDRYDATVAELAKVRGTKSAGLKRNLYGEYSGIETDYVLTDLAERWQGYGTALKPAYEPVILARAPRAPHTYAALAREFGTGAINVDGARIPANGDVMRRANNVTIGGNGIYQGGRAFETGATDGRRWPANVILDETAAAALDAMSGETKVDSRSLSTYNIRTVDKTEVNLCCANASIAVVSSMLGHQMSSVDTGVSVAANAVTLRGEKPEKTRHGDIFAPQTDGGIGSGENSEAAKSTHNLSIDGCGNSTMVPFQTGMKSTTSTEIRQTTTCQTCGSYLQVSMTISTNASARITRLGLMVSSAAGVNDAANTSLSLNLPLAVPEHIAAIVSRVQDWLLGNGEKKTANTITPTCENTASDGPSRFFYTAKAAAWERTAGLPERSKHPTMKPIRLTEYLATMLLPPVLEEPRRLLVPFSGVGSEMIGAQLAGWDEIDGIEQDADYCVDAYNRIVWWNQFSSYEEAQKHYKQNKTDFGGWS